MITLEHLQKLFSERKIQECIEAASIFLLFNEDSIAALLLKAKCHFELGKNCDEMAEAMSMFTTAYQNLEKILSQEATHEEALFFAAYICIYFLRENVEDAISYCKQLESSANWRTTLKAFEYLQEAYVLLDDADNALITLTELQTLINLNCENDRSLKDTHLNWVYIRKAYIYLELKNDVPSALEAYKQGFKHAIGGRREDAFIARFAFENNDNDFGTAVFYNALQNGYNGSEENLVFLNVHAQKLLENGYRNSALFHAVILAMKTLFDRRSFNEDNVEDEIEDEKNEIISYCQQYIKMEPEWYEPYYFTGVQKLDEGNYQEAYQNLKLSLEKGGKATFKLDKVYEAKRILVSIEEDYNSFLELNKSSLSENNFKIIDKLLQSAQDFRALLFLDPTDNDAAITAWTNIVTNEGSDSFAFYELTRLNHLVENYENVVRYANGYLIIMAGCLKPEREAVICFHAGIAQIELCCYVEGINILQRRLVLSDAGHPPMPLGKMYIDYYMAIAFYNLKDWQGCLVHSWNVIEWYKKKSKEWDDKIEKMTLYYADACKATGKIDAAIGTVENMLRYLPDNTEALIRKKEWKKSKGLFSFLKK